MAEVKWIKICTDIFDDEKIALIESMPEADGIIVVWFKLLCMAGKQNNGGVFMLNNKIAYTDEMLATIFRRPLNTVRLALSTFEQFGMIEVVNNAYTIPNWEKHQSMDKLEKAKELNRLRVAKHREKQKQLAFGGSTICQYCGNAATGLDHIIPIARGGKDIESNTVPCCIDCNRKKNDKPLVDFLNTHRDIINDHLVLSNAKLSKFVTICNVTGHYIVTECNAVEEDKEEDKNKIRERIDYEHIKDMFNDICISFSRLTVLSDKRKQAIKARLNTYTVEQFREMFMKAEASSFLKGSNNRNWQANFDWLIKDSNFAKVLDGNYDDKAKQNTGVETNGTNYGNLKIGEYF